MQSLYLLSPDSSERENESISTSTAILENLELATYLGSNTSPLFVDYVSIYSGVELRFLAS